MYIKISTFTVKHSRKLGARGVDKAHAVVPSKTKNTKQKKSANVVSQKGFAFIHGQAQRKAWSE